MKKIVTTAAALAVLLCAACNTSDDEDFAYPAFIRVEGGTFKMGSPEGDNTWIEHPVTLTGFYMAQYEVTQKEYESVMGNNPSIIQGAALPVNFVTWYQAVEYCNKRSEKESLTPVYTINGDNTSWDRSANGYRLPTEAEWEYAARGGAKGSKTYLTYAGSNTPDGVGWYNLNSRNTVHKGGQKAPNALGIYDMSGNVAEWCWDWYNQGGYSGESEYDPEGPPTAQDSKRPARVLRGGSFSQSVTDMRSWNRGSSDPVGYEQKVGGIRLVRP